MPNDAPSSVSAYETLLLPAKEAARLCGLGLATWYRRVSAGQTPGPVRIGGAVRWRRRDLELWVSWGCPPRGEFEARINADGRPARASR